jgi:hypothetical protein
MMKQPKGLHSAVVAFESTPEFELCRTTNGRKGLLDVDAILARDAPAPEPPNTARKDTLKLHGVVWSAVKHAWMVSATFPQP